MSYRRLAADGTPRKPLGSAERAPPTCRRTRSRCPASVAARAPDEREVERPVDVERAVEDPEALIPGGPGAQARALEQPVRRHPGRQRRADRVELAGQVARVE